MQQPASLHPSIRPLSLSLSLSLSLCLSRLSRIFLAVFDQAMPCVCWGVLSLFHPTLCNIAINSINSKVSLLAYHVVGGKLIISSSS